MSDWSAVFNDLPRASSQCRNWIAREMRLRAYLRADRLLATCRRRRARRSTDQVA